MALQLTGAAKTSSIANLQLRLPVVVIGGGLTAIDTATESLAYYVRQVEKFALRYRTLVAERGETRSAPAGTMKKPEIADEFMAHAARDPRRSDAAAAETAAPRLAELLDSWGGATIAYRRRLIDRPVLHPEPRGGRKAMEEGVRFAEGLTPGRGGGRRLRPRRRRYGVQARRTAAEAIAAGALHPRRRRHQPNTVLAREDHSIRLDGKYFRAVDEDGNPVDTRGAISKPTAPQVLMHRSEDGRFV